MNAVLAGKGNYGFNAANDTYGDMIEMGILDPDQGHPHRAAERGLRRIPDADDRKPWLPKLRRKSPAPAAACAGGMGGMGGMGDMGM